MSREVGKRKKKEDEPLVPGSTIQMSRKGGSNEENRRNVSMYPRGEDVGEESGA
jgi:hypothetical protein